MSISNSNVDIETRLAKIAEYGAMQGSGDSALANAFLQCIIGGGEGAFDTVKRNAQGVEDKKHGADHAELAYRRYVDAYSRMDAHKASTITKGASYFRTGIKAGMKCGDSAEGFADAIATIYSKGKKDGRDMRKPIEAFVKAATAQNESPTQLTTDEILGAMLAPEKKEKEVKAIELVSNAHKLLAKAHELDSSQEIALALEATQAALSFLAHRPSATGETWSWKDVTGEVVDADFEEVAPTLLIAAE